MTEPPLRIIDANANRAREAMRTLEDVARFALDDAELAEPLKRMRHTLAETLAPLDLALLLHRDTPGDVGTRIATDAEYARRSLADVAQAAAKRLTEALRCIEESLKILADTADARVHPGAPARVEAARYQTYEIDRRLRLALLGPRAEFRGFRLCLLLTESLCAGRDPLDVARRAIEGGADCVQLREKHMDAGPLLTRARALVHLCREHDAAVVINDRPDVARLADADAVHLGQTDLPVDAARRILGEDRLIGLSTASLDQARDARDAAVDLCGVGPMFPSATKPRHTLPGPAYLREYLREDPALPPPLAISGVTPERVPELIEAAEGRTFGIAVSSAICGADDPERAARTLRSLIDPVWNNQ